MITFSSDRLLDDNVPKIKLKAERIRKGEGLEEVEDVILRLRYWFSAFYKIPMKSPVLDEYTVEELFLEYFMHNPPSAEEQKAEVSKTIATARDEIADEMFKDFADFSDTRHTLGQASNLTPDEGQFMDKVFGQQEEQSWSMDEETLNGSK